MGDIQCQFVWFDAEQLVMRGHIDALRVSFDDFWLSPFKCNGRYDSVISVVDCCFRFIGWDFPGSFDEGKGGLAEIEGTSQYAPGMDSGAVIGISHGPVTLKVVGCQFWNLPECVRSPCFLTNSCEQHGCSPDRLIEHDNMFLGLTSRGMYSRSVVVRPV